MNGTDGVDPMERYYEISIGDHSAGAEGPWWKGVANEHLDVAKTRVRSEVAALLVQIKAPYTLDLDSVLMANGIDPHGGDHIAISDDVHRRVMAGWLQFVRAQIKKKQNWLWLPDVEKTEDVVQVRCCAGTGDKWHACLAMQLYKGPSLAKAQPWSVRISGETIDQDDGVEVPILIAGSWRCARMEAMTADMVVKPFRGDTSAKANGSSGNGVARARRGKGNTAPAGGRRKAGKKTANR